MWPLDLENRINNLFPFRIGCRLSIGYGLWWKVEGWELPECSSWLSESQFVTVFLVLVRDLSWVWSVRPVWWSPASKLRRAALTSGYVARSKLVLFWGLKILFGVCFGYPASGWRVVVPIHRGAVWESDGRGSGWFRLYVWFVIFL
jgi:hypothetical protein